jgi:thiamine biosynthesis protein ThiS
MTQQPSFVLNDERRALEPGLTVHALLERLDPTMPIAVVKIAGQHVPRRTWQTRAIQPDDEVRVVYIIAGG